MAFVGVRSIISGYAPPHITELDHGVTDAQPCS